MLFQLSHQPHSLAHAIQPTRKITTVDEPLVSGGGEETNPFEEGFSMSITSLYVTATAFATFSLLIFVKFVPPATLYDWHPASMSLSIGMVGASAALGIYIRRIPPGRDRVKALWTHLALNSCGIFLWLVGVASIYANKNNIGKPHFTSDHGFVGICATLGMVFTHSLGIASFNVLGVLGKLGLGRHINLTKATHRRLSVVVVFAGIYAAGLKRRHDSIGHGALAGFLTDLSLGVATVGLAVSALTTRAWNAK